MNDDPSYDNDIIEPPNEEDILDLAQKLNHAAEMMVSIAGTKISHTEKDFDALQAILDSNALEPEATYSLEALGIAFGCAFINIGEHFDWCIVTDDMGRDPAIRYKETTLLIFPQDMILKRVEEGEAICVRELYDDLCASVEEIIEENYEP
jgi:hypothetical protein